MAEARARLQCDDKVRAEYVTEATRLLQKSIIFVESDDVVLEDDLDRTIRPTPTEVRLEAKDDKGKEEEKDEIIQEEEGNGEGEEKGMEVEKREGERSGADVAAAADESKGGSAPSRKRKRTTERKAKKSERKTKRREITITFEKYQQISNLMVMLLRRREEAEGEAFRGVTQRDCVEMYLSEVKAESAEDVEVLRYSYGKCFCPFSFCIVRNASCPECPSAAGGSRSHFGGDRRE